MENLCTEKCLSYLEKEMIQAPYCSDKMKTISRNTSALQPYFEHFKDVAEQLNAIIPADKHHDYTGEADLFYSPFGKFCFIATPDAIDPNAFPSNLDLKVRRIIIQKNSISDTKYYLNAFVPKVVSTNDRYFTIQSKIHAISVFSMMLFFMTHFDMSRYSFKTVFPDNTSFRYIDEYGTPRMVEFCTNVHLEGVDKALFKSIEAAFNKGRPFFISLQAYYRPREEELLEKMLIESERLGQAHRRLVKTDEKEVLEGLLSSAKNMKRRELFVEVGYGIFSVFY